MRSMQEIFAGVGLGAEVVIPIAVFIGLGARSHGWLTPPCHTAVVNAAYELTCQ
jgi:hypothetical protein